MNDGIFGNYVVTDLRQHQMNAESISSNISYKIHNNRAKKQQGMALHVAGGRTRHYQKGYKWN